MSRIGRLPIPIPAGVDVDDRRPDDHGQGPQGRRSPASSTPTCASAARTARSSSPGPTEQKTHKQLHGLTRTLVNNMVVGVTDGYRKGLEITGVGYRAVQGRREAPAEPRLQPPDRDRPAGRASRFEVENPTRLAVVGIDKELVGQVAAQVRATRKPEPYKGKGVRYAGEQVRRKAGKAGKIGGKK